MKKTYLIIGTSAAGYAAAMKLRQLDVHATIICISDEQELPYNKCFLADYVSGSKSEQQLYTMTSTWCEQKNITVLLGRKVIALHLEQKEIQLDDGRLLQYDALILTMGTRPRQLSNADYENMFTFHRLKDVQRLLADIDKQTVKKAVVIGSGLSGLECADSLLQRGVEVTVVEAREHILSTHLPHDAAQHIEHLMHKNGVKLYVQSTVQEIKVESNRVTAVKLTDGTILSADVMIVAIGLQPNLELLTNTVIAHTPQGIIVDEYMRTTVPAVYAAGDITLVKEQLTGLQVPSRTWPDAMLQGSIAACAIAGQPKAYPGTLSLVSSSFFGIKFAVCGLSKKIDDHQELLINHKDTHYHSFIVEHNILKGFTLVGNTANMSKLRQAVATGLPIDPTLLCL